MADLSVNLRPTAPLDADRNFKCDTLWLEVSFTSKSNGRPCHYANEFETAFQLFQKFSRKSLGESKNP